MFFSGPGHSYPPMPQSPQSRDYSRINNQNNRGIIGNASDNFVNSGSINITQVTNADDELDRLLDGCISKGALHNSYHSPPECYSGTRKTVRNVIGDWMDGSSSAKSPLLWLHGPAGVGKSVIAKTIAGSHDRVIATFFFSASSDRSAATLFPTLAWQLAQRIPETKQHIIASLKNNGLLLTSEIKEQFEHLIAQPLRKCTVISTSLPVMVIDGIDECTDEYALSQFLQVLVRAGESGEMPLRFIICSRPESRIRAILKKKKNHRGTEWQPSAPHSLQRRSPLYWRPRVWIQSLLPEIGDIRNRFYIPIIWGFRNPTLLLQEVWKVYRPVKRGVGTSGPSPEIRADIADRISPHPVISDIQIGFSEECREDIARYLTDQFNAMGYQLGEDPGSWFQQCDISQLVERSCGQFLYVSTIVKLLEDSHPKDVLEMARNSSLPTPDLNKLYNVILKRAKDAIRNRAQEGGPDSETELRVLTDTLAILVVFAENNHFFNMRENFVVIESLIGIEKGRLTKKLCKMDSVLDIVPEVSINVYHRSFVEFLQSQKRSGEHYVAYPRALRRFLFLLSRAGFGYLVRDLFGKLLSRDNLNDGKMREQVENMALAFRRNYFKRSSSPTTLIALHDLIHCSLPLICLVPFIPQLKESVIGASTSSFAFAFILEYLFLAFFRLLILSSGSFIISLAIYTLVFNHSFILPFFHPFLHPIPHVVAILGILLSSRQTSSQSENYKSDGTNPKRQGMGDIQEEQEQEKLETKKDARPRLGACNRCKRLKVRCEFKAESETCKRCFDGGHECFIPVRTKRQAPPKQNILLSKIREQEAMIQNLRSQLETINKLSPDRTSEASGRECFIPSDTEQSETKESTRSRLGACLRCKNLKVKCEIKAESDICKRCFDGRHECFIPDGKKRRAPSKRELLLSKIREQEAVIQNLRSQLETMNKLSPDRTSKATNITVNG